VKRKPGRPKKIFLALRRDKPGSPAVWRPVWGLPLTIPGAKAWKLFTYRDGPLVFAVDAETGLTVSRHATIPLVQADIVKQLEGRNIEEVRSALQKDAEFINAGPKPKVQFL
jgi:hypothetical protein